MRKVLFIFTLSLLAGLFLFGRIERAAATTICYYAFYSGQLCKWCLSSPNLGCGPANGEYYDSQPDNNLVCKDTEVWGSWAPYISWTINPSIQEVDDGWTWGCKYDYYRSGTKWLCSGHVPIHYSWRGTGIGRTGCKAYKNTPPPACDVNIANHYFDDNDDFENQSADGLCDVGTPSAVSYDSDTWTWDWSCISGTSTGCQAYQNAQCGSAEGGTFVEAPSEPPLENLCSVGTPSEVVPNDDVLWEWKCFTDKIDAATECFAIQESVEPFCSLSPNPVSVCSGETSTITVNSLAPSKESSSLTRVDWSSPNSDESGHWDRTQPDVYNNLTWNGEKFLFNVEELSSLGSNPINFLVNSGTGSYETQCATTIYVKPSGCDVIVSPSDNLIVGTQVDVIIVPECIEPDSYSLQILYQGVDDPSSWEHIDSDLSDGQITIEIKEAGLFTFKAIVTGTLNGSDSTTNCDCQTTALTAGSKWWERDTE